MKLHRVSNYALVLSAALGISLWAPGLLRAQNFVVTTGNGSGTGSLAAAITAANAYSVSNPGIQATITFSGVSTVNLPTSGSGQLFVDSNVTINGGSGETINGHNNDRIFFIAGGTVNLENLTLKNGSAVGGNSGFGGGGAGLGGAIFVADGKDITGSNVTLATNVTLSNVSFTNNSATGGASGVGYANGGGGMGGNGGGPGGGFGNGADGPNTRGTAGGAGAFIGGASGGAGTGSGAGAGGINGGGGGGFGPSGGFNGGGGVDGASGSSGEAGGFGGGGGGANGAAGGFGGGGALGEGHPGGNGGFGGGGGAGEFEGGQGGFGAGNGDRLPDYGGGGLGAGGAVFVQQGATLTVVDGSVSGNTVVSGTTNTTDGATNGQALGSGMFLNGSGTLTFSPGNGQSVNVSDNIADQTGNGGTGVNAGSWSVLIDATGTGSVTLSGTNSYSGGTTLQSGTLVLGNSNALGTGALITIDPTVVYANGDNIANPIIMEGDTVLEIDGKSHSATQTGTISESGGSYAIDKIGTGTLILAGANTYSGGTTIDMGTLVIDNNSGLGTGSVTLNGTSTLEIGANYQVAANGLTGTMGTTVDLDNSAALQVTVASGTNTFSGELDSDKNGLEFLIKAGSGTLVLNGTAKFYGVVGVEQGELDLNSDTALSTGSYLEVASGAQVVENNSNVTIGQLVTTGMGDGNVLLNGGSITLNATNAMNSFGGNISGTGSLVMSGNSSSSETLSGNNTYSGDTDINGGTLVAGSTTAFSQNSSVNVTGNGTLDLDGYSNTIASLSGNGNVTNNAGSGTAVLTIGTVGGTFSTVFSGNLNDGSSATLGIELASGTLTITSANNNNYTGGTTIDSGATLQLGNNGTTGSVNGDVVDNGVLIYDHSNNHTSNAIISGTGSLVQNGTGTLTITQMDTYTGATIVNAGTLAINANGDIADSSNVSLTAAGTSLKVRGGQTIQNLTGVAGSTVDIGPSTLTESSTVDGTFAGIIFGTGSVIKQGTGAWTLSGASTYSGTTTLNAGTLIAANSAAFGTSAFTLNAGTLQTDNINHVITVGGNYVQTGGTLLLNINSVTPGSASNDVLNVNGTAQLNGALKINYVPGTLAPTQEFTYTVVTTTAGITSVGSGFLTPTLQSGALTLTLTGSVVGENFDLTVAATQNSFTSLAGTNFNANQYNVASYFDRFDKTVYGGPIAPLLAALDTISVNPGSLGPAFDQLTPLKFGSFASTTAFNNSAFYRQQFDSYLASHRNGDGTFVGSNGGIDYSGLTMNDPEVDQALQSVRSRLLAWSPAPNTGLISDVGDPVLGGIDMKDMMDNRSPGATDPWDVFISGNVILAQDFSNPTAGLAGANATTGAVQAGADYKVTQNFLVGATFAYGHTSATLDTIGSNATVNTYSPGVYASYSQNGWYANSIASYGFANYGQNRAVAIGAFNGTAHSSPGGDQIVGDLDGGYDFHKGALTIGPTAGLGYTHLDVDAYTETGLPGADLSVNAQHADSLRSLFGGHLSYLIHNSGMLFTPHLSASWQHEYFNQSRGITSQFNGVGAGSFAVNTVNPSRDSALVDTGLDLQINNALTTFVDYAVQAGQNNYFGQSVQAGFKIGF
jgi:autotransporter-associated beta strand protein